MKFPAMPGDLVITAFPYPGHPSKPGLVTVAGKSSATLKEKTEASILRQAGLRKEQA
jgi:hypothetical protein